MKAKELKQKSKNELEKLLKENRAKLQEFNFDLAAGKMKKVRNVRKIKKDIARILTSINKSQNSKLKSQI
ncbi:MAG: 50S ribosomal protein L29 [Patescibacteria group bacterium]|nr:50S ribosomal protein L29 [Patescibacteria group bacterium]